MPWVTYGGILPSDIVTSGRYFTSANSIHCNSTESPGIGQNNAVGTNDLYRSVPGKRPLLVSAYVPNFKVSMLQVSYQRFYRVSAYVGWNQAPIDTYPGNYST